RNRLSCRELDPARIQGILVTHEHSDHTSGVGLTARRLTLPIYATRGSLSKMNNFLDGSELLVPVESGVPFSIGPFDIQPYGVPHDAVEPVQYCIRSGRKNIVIATDIGFASTLVVERLKDADILVIESNYDLELLRKSSYPWPVKQRIMGKTGHLSNRNASELIFNLSRNGAMKVILAHLSEDNNYPELAEQTVRELFEKYERPLDHLFIATQHEATPVIEI
ncbi:MBL fold metallo-hydrolase, partial [Candidatus Latescibacterota bacterium]